MRQTCAVNIHRCACIREGSAREPGAIQAFSDDPGAFDLVVTDSNMPEMSGVELAKRLLEIRPDADVVLTSGYLRAEEIERARQVGVRDVILKPNTVEELAPMATSPWLPEPIDDSYASAPQFTCRVTRHQPRPATLPLNSITRAHYVYVFDYRSFICAAGEDASWSGCSI